MQKALGLVEICCLFYLTVFDICVLKTWTVFLFVSTLLKVNKLLRDDFVVCYSERVFCFGNIQILFYHISKIRKDYLSSVWNAV